MSKIQYFIIDGADGVGKTVQLKLIGQAMEASGLKVHYTQLLGGDRKDFVQAELRKLLLNPEFPADSVEDEEELFGITDRRGIRISVRKLMSSEPADVVLQDRGWPSHVAYALAKGMSAEEIDRVHLFTRDAYSDLNYNLELVHVILLPEDERMAMDRVISRGQPTTPRLENLETQRKVISAMQPENFGPWEIGKTVYVTVKRDEDIPTVNRKILLALSEAGVSLW